MSNADYLNLSLTENSSLLWIRQDDEGEDKSKLMTNMLQLRHEGEKIWTQNN